jgi:trypsin
MKSHLRSVPQPRIIGGGETQPTRYPFTVSLQNVQHFCGGTLIASDVVLTAAHCTIIDFSEVTVVIGSHTVDGKTSMGNEVEKLGVTRVYTHPEYNALTNNYDFALIFLDTPTTSNVKYARLNDDAQVPSTADTLTAIGWGDTSAGEGYDYSNILMEVDVDYMENEDCDASSDSQDSYKGMIFDAMLCASRPGKDGCQGDSGGPIIIKGSDASQDVQVGIASWGYGCASPDFPGVYSRVSVGYKWIRNRVCRRSLDPPEWFDCWEKKTMSYRFAYNKNGKRIKGEIVRNNVFKK